MMGIVDRLIRSIISRTAMLSCLRSVILEPWGSQGPFAKALISYVVTQLGSLTGTDIAHQVLCGRVADASPAVGAAAWWHGWGPENHQELACALMAGTFA